MLSQIPALDLVMRIPCLIDARKQKRRYRCINEENTLKRRKRRGREVEIRNESIRRTNNKAMEEKGRGEEEKEEEKLKMGKGYFQYLMKTTIYKMQRKLHGQEEDFTTINI